MCNNHAIDLQKWAHNLHTLRHEKHLTIMKRFYTFALCLLALMTACNDDDDSVKVPEAVTTSFDTMYPSARLDGWLTWRGFMVADFELNGADHQAWYDKSGRWYMTDSEIDYRSLPAAVRTAYQNSAYSSGWEIDDMEELARAEMDTIYIIEIWQLRSQLDLYYTSNGVLVDTEPYGYGDPTIWVPAAVPSAVKGYLDSNYAGYSMIQIVVDSGMTAAIINYNQSALSVQFDSTYKWLRTVETISESEVPEPVMSALAGSEYSAYIIRAISRTIDSTGETYTFALTNGTRNVTLRISAEGSIIK